MKCLIIFSSNLYEIEELNETLHSFKEDMKHKLKVENMKLKFYYSDSESFIAITSENYERLKEIAR